MHGNGISNAFHNAKHGNVISYLFHNAKHGNVISNSFPNAKHGNVISYLFHNAMHANAKFIQICEQVRGTLNIPASAVLCSYVTLENFILPISVIEIPKTDWTEPVLVWLTIYMPTGSRKSTVF